MKEVVAEVVVCEEIRPAGRVRVLGPVGVVLALLTMLAALGVVFLMLFGTPIISAAAVFALWPRVFSPQFTQWVFGAERVSFWKLFLVFLAAGAVVKLFRPSSYRNKKDGTHFPQ